MSDVTKSPKAVIEAYEIGTRTRDIAIQKAIFADAAHMSCWLGSNFMNGTPVPFFEALAQNEVGPDYRSETVSLTESGAIATAQTREENLLGADFENHFQLVQIEDGTWRITAKLFRTV